MNEWSGINDEYELTEWETQDEKWVQCGPHMWYLRERINAEEADALMQSRLREMYGEDL